MLRAIASVVVAFVLMELLFEGARTGLYLALGAERVFEPGAWTPSGLWVSLMLIVGIITALAGGWVCKAIAKSGKPPRVLAAIFLVLGIIAAISTRGAPAPTESRGPNVARMEAMDKAVRPIWFTVANSLTWFLGVMVGAGLGKERAGGAKITP